MRLFTAFTLALLALTPPALAQVLVSTNAGVVSAHNRRITLTGHWSVDGVQHATAAVANGTHVAVLDALNDEAVIVDLETGALSRVETAATPIAAAFLGSELFILARDARLLQRAGDATGLQVAADPAFLAVSRGKLYVYCRAAGIIQETDGERLLRTIQVGPFASDFDIAGGTAYLTFPREARIRTVALSSMTNSGEIAVGAVPVSLDFAGGGTALTARILAVADPSAKRVWLAEGTQSTAEAVGRGFLRGLLGLGLFGGRAPAFATGVDRVQTRGSRWIAYDSSSRTLYQFTRKGSSVVARDVGPQAFTLTSDSVAWWAGTSVAEKPFR